MSKESEVEILKTWARSLGYSSSFPSEESIKRLFRDGQGTFSKIIERVRPLQEVKHIKENILANKMKNVKKQDRLITKSAGSKVPSQFIRFNQLNQMKKEVLETESRVNSTRKSLEEILAEIKAKNIKKMQLQDALKTSSSKQTILSSKHKNLKSMLEKETETRNKLQKIMPNILDKSNPVSDQNAKTAYLKCHSHLEKFYESKDYSKNQQAKLYEKLRFILKGMPNSMLFNVLLTEMEQLLHEVIETKNCKDSSTANNNVDYQVSKLCARHINLFVELVATEKARRDITQSYCQSFSGFEDVVSSQISLVNELDDEHEHILNDYIYNYNLIHFIEGKIDFLTREVEKLKLEYKVNAEKLSHHDHLVSEIQEIYDHTSDVCSSIQDDIGQLHQVKDKIMYTKECTLYMVKNVRLESNVNKTLLSNSTIRIDSSVVQPILDPLPPYVDELKLFNSIPMKFTKPTQNFLKNLTTNPALVNQPNLISFPFHLLTINGCLKQIQELVNMDDHSIAPHTQDLQPTDEIVALDKNYYDIKKKENYDKILEVIDAIKSVQMKNSFILDKCQEYYDFIISNCLRQFVPPSKQFNGHTYKQYESEFNVHYRMLYGNQ